MIVASMTSWKRSITSSFTQQPTLTFKAEFSFQLMVIKQIGMVEISIVINMS